MGQIVSVTQHQALLGLVSLGLAFTHSSWCRRDLPLPGPGPFLTLVVPQLGWNARVNTQHRYLTSSLNINSQNSPQVRGPASNPLYSRDNCTCWAARKNLAAKRSITVRSNNKRRVNAKWMKSQLNV